MVTPERRRFPRTQMARIACIHIEPENGGIVLNVSSEGLCFHSTVPVERNGTFRFALVEHNRRIDAAGELIWTESTGKIGGVRFSTLSTEAREQIQSWSLATADDVQAASTSRPNFAKTLSLLSSIEFRKAAPGAARADTGKHPRVRIRLSSFSRGLATGLLLATLIASVFFFFSAHRRQFGESLINLGEKLSARPRSTAASSSAPQVNPQPAQVSGNKSAPPASANAPLAEAAVATRSSSKPATTQIVDKIRSAILVKPEQGVKGVRALPMMPPNGPTKKEANHHAASLPPTSPITSAALRIPAPSNILPEIAVKPPQLAASAVTVPNFAGDSVFVPSMYFDLGKYKDQMRAQDISDRVARLGFRANVVQKAFLWRSSYQVLVGPYTDEQKATQVGRDLALQGYKPRPFERGTRDFMFGSGVTLNGTTLPVGDFEISWESFVNAAKVKFSQRDEVLMKTEGRWVKQPMRFRHNEFVYIKSPNGTRTLIEVHFSGMDRALVFGKES